LQNVTYIGEQCFRGCSNLKKIIVEDKEYSTLEKLHEAIHIGDNCFDGCLLFNKEAVIPQTDVLNEMPQAVEWSYRYLVFRRQGASKVSSMFQRMSSWRIHPLNNSGI
jgi:hypothetical protein